MHATIRRYEGVDTTRMNEVVGKVNETLVPQLRELPGFAGYYLIEADNGILSSLSLFEDARAGRRVHEARHEVDQRRELHLGDSERAEDHQRQGRCSQRPRPRRRLARPYSASPRGPAQPGLSCTLAQSLNGLRELRRGKPREAEVDADAVAGAVVDRLRLSPREIPVTWWPTHAPARGRARHATAKSRIAAAADHSERAHRKSDGDSL